MKDTLGRWECWCRYRSIIVKSIYIRGLPQDNSVTIDHSLKISNKIEAKTSVTPQLNYCSLKNHYPKMRD